MSKSLIRTRAEEDAADLILKRSTMPSPTLPTAPIIEPPSAPSASPSASAAMDSMWSEYEQYLQAAKAAQEAAIDIFPQPAFVVKVSLVNNNRQGQTASRVKKDLLEDDERGDNDSDKLFINVCMDACVDAPSIVKQSNNTLQPSTAIASSDSSPAPATPPPGSLRLPMSVGPLTPCTSRSGSPSVCVDVVIHPSTLAPPLDAAHSQAAYQYAVAQAALIERQSGTAPPVLTPAQQQAVAMRELKRTVAAFALQRIEEKYKLRINAEPEIKFPKAAYKGTLPPPVQRIRRNKDNPLHAMTPQQREEAERKGKVMVQEVWVAQQSKPTAALAADAAAARATHPSKTGTAHTAPVKLATEDSSRNERHMAGEQQSVGTDEKQTKPSASAVEESTTEVEKSTMANGSAAVTPVYTLDVNDKALTLQVQLPGVVSSLTITAALLVSIRPALCLNDCVVSAVSYSLCRRQALGWMLQSHPPTYISLHSRTTNGPRTSCTWFSQYQWMTSAYKPNSTRRSTPSHSPYQQHLNHHHYQHQ